MPYIEPTEKNPLKALKSELFDLIVKNRIYKEEDVQELFKYTREANPHLNKNILEKAITLTYNSLND